MGFCRLREYSYRPLDVKLSVDVTTEGGTLTVFFDGGKAFLKGKVNDVFEGYFYHGGFEEKKSEI